MIEFTLAGQIVPKARPRCQCVNGYAQATTDEKYKVWKSDAAGTFLRQSSDLRLAGPIIETGGIQIELYGKHYRGSDSDNIAGSILDALQDAGVLAKDNLMAVPSLFISLQWSKQSPTTKIFIEDCL